jgi:hypothetical protein
VTVHGSVVEIMLLGEQINGGGKGGRWCYGLHFCCCRDFLLSFLLFVWMAEDQKFGCPLLRRNFGCICADAEEYIIIIYFLNGPGASRRKGKRWWYL